MEVDLLVIDNYPKINLTKNTISTEYSINECEEVSISINNKIILNKSDIKDIVNNIIILTEGIDILNNDTVSVIYNRI